MRNPGKYLLAAAVVTSVLVAAPLALGAGEGRPLDGGARNPSDDARQNYTRETEIIANVGTYGTRQSNKSADGRWRHLRLPRDARHPGARACARATSPTASAFSFASQRRRPVGRDRGAAATAKPFTTNATGVADGLNADQVDSKNASELTSTPWPPRTCSPASAERPATLGATRGATTAGARPPGSTW